MILILTALLCGIRQCEELVTVAVYEHAATSGVAYNRQDALAIIQKNLDVLHSQLQEAAAKVSNKHQKCYKMDQAMPVFETRLDGV